MARGSTRSYTTGGLLLPALLWLAGTHPAAAGGSEIRGLATYFILIEAGASTPPGRLDEPAVRRIAAADWSLDLNRATAAFGIIGDFGACELTATQNMPPAQRAAGLAAAVSYHAYVAPSYAYLPVAYQRDFVRSGLIGFTDGTNKLLIDAAIPVDNKLLALGQYLHFTQDIFFHQDAIAGKPFEVGADSVAKELDRDRAAPLVVTDSGGITDAALRAFAFTYQVARAFNQKGSLPPLPAADKFDRTFYAPLSASDRVQITEALQSAGVWQYLETIAQRTRPPNGSPKAMDRVSSAQAHADLAKLKISLAEVWSRSHPKEAAIRPPQIYAWGGDDFVDYDAHPDWLIRNELRSSEMTARRPIDDLALEQQAGNQLQAKIDRFESALKEKSDQQQRNAISVTIEALKKYYADADSALKHSATAKTAPEKRQFIATALQSLRQGLRAAEQTELTLADSKQAVPSNQCENQQAAATAAFNRDINEIVKMSVAVGFASSTAPLTPEDQKLCLMIAFDYVRGALVGGAPDVPETCRPASNAGRVTLVRYAAAHLRTWDPRIENLLSEFVARQRDLVQPDSH
jgi:hypothetical protein